MNAILPQFRDLQPLHKAPPKLPAEVFQGWLGDFVTATADATETPIELAASFALATIATAVQKKMVVSPEEGYIEPLNVYTAVFLPSGTRKSAVMNRFMAPLVKYEAEKSAEMKPKIISLAAERKTREAHLKALRDKAAKSAGDLDIDLITRISDLEANIPDLPEVPRLICQDITPEHLGTMLHKHGEKMALFSDEGGIFETLAGRYSNQIPNLDLVLQAFSGSPVRVDRGSRPPVLLNTPALTIAVSPQPSVAHELGEKKGFVSRGLLARFLFTWPESNLGYRILTPKPTSEDVAMSYQSHMLELLDAGVTEYPTELRLDKSAYQMWKAFQDNIEKMMSRGQKLAKAQDIGGKMPGICARIAGLLHIADNGISTPSPLIGSDVVARAILLAEFHLEHGLYVMGKTGADTATQAAQRLWEEISAIDEAIVNARIAWMPTRSKYKTIEQAEPGFQLLIERGWIAEIPKCPGKKGRKSRMLAVNPLASSAHFAHAA